MQINLTKALSAFTLSKTAVLDCGEFNIRIRQAAIHNEEFKVAVTKRALRAKKHSLVPTPGTMTGNFDEDVSLIVDTVMVGWGDKPLTDDEGKVLEYTPELATVLFTSTDQGKVLFNKVVQAAMADATFAGQKDDGLGNS